ncbi:MAG: hypothetical protein AAEJ65_09235 [Planctomycetota bacterium]
MAHRRQNPATNPTEEDRFGGLPVPSRESQWLDVVSCPAPLLPARIEPQQPSILDDELVPLQPVESAQPSEPRIATIRTTAIIVLTIIFLLSWQQKAGEESTVDPITAATILDN